MNRHHTLDRIRKACNSKIIQCKLGNKEPKPWAMKDEARGGLYLLRRLLNVMRHKRSTLQDQA